MNESQTGVLTTFETSRLVADGFMTANHTHNVDGIWITD